MGNPYKPIVKRKIKEYGLSVYNEDNYLGGGSVVPAGWTPDQEAGLVVWLKADAITGLNDGDGVATWVDSSGNGNDVTQGNVGNRPFYKVNIINGKPIVRFNGGKFLDNAAFVQNPPNAIFIVANVADLASSYHFIDGISQRQAVYSKAGNGFSYFAGLAEISDGALIANQFFMGYCLFQVQLNQSLISTDFDAIIVATNPGPNGIDGLRIGTFSPPIGDLLGDIAEIIIYAGQKSGILQNVKQYFIDRYAL